MKKLFKFLIKFILIIVFIVILIIATLFFMFYNGEDNAPNDLYDTSSTVNGIIATELSNSLDNLGTSYSFDMIFDEESLNQLIFTFIRNQINEEYNPGVENPTTKQEYIVDVYKFDSSYPVIGGQNVGIKSVYANYKGDDLAITLTARVANVLKTRVYILMNVETQETEFIMKVKELTIGNVNIANQFLVDIVKMIGLDSELKYFLRSYGLPFDFDIDKLAFSVKKTELSDWVKALLDSNNEPNSMKSILIDTFFSPENDMVFFGMFTRGFGIHVNLDSLLVSEESTTMPSTLSQAFNAEEVISNKVQTMVINNIANPLGDKYLSFTENDMTQLVYTKTEGYNDFAVDAEIIDGVFFHFDVAGIIFDINDDGSEIVIKVILNINGLKTTAVLKGRVEQVSDKIVKVFIDDVISLGSDLNISSEFMSQMLAQNFTNGELMEFSAEENALIFSADVFNTFIANAMGSSSTPLKVKKLQFSKDGLDIYVEYSDPVLGAAMTTVTNMISNTLENGLALDPSDFSAEDAEALASVQENLNSISESLTNGSLTEEDTNALIDSVNSLSSEGQAAFFESIKDNVANEEELTNLYNLLFN